MGLTGSYMELARAIGRVAYSSTASEEDAACLTVIADPACGRLQVRVMLMDGTWTEVGDDDGKED